MKKTLLPILLFSLLMQTGYAQEVIRIGFVQAGMLCGDASLAPGILLNQNISTVSVPLSAEYYLDSRISIKADIYLHVSSGMTSDSLTLISNHQLFTGLAYHFRTKGYFDPYVGFQPGVSYAQIKSDSKTESLLLNAPDLTYHANLVPVAA
ncbi:MAG TPA: hypothetical protein VNZ86_06950, partial [Bacteroidia bacterium]|nr:hypothetical protein [Bacteroidia bacterium]